MTKGRAGGEQGDLFATAAPVRPVATPEPPPPSTAPPALDRVPAWRRAAPPPEPTPVATVASSVVAPALVPERRLLTVSELTRDIKSALERSFPRVLVRGEVSGFRGPNARGHLYFSIKDAGACIDVKVWASMAQRLGFQLKDGQSLVVEGAVNVYEPSGRYSLIASRLEPEGVGALALAFEQMKQRLAAEGLLGDKRVRPPRPLPFLPRRIGVVTSITGAALRDFLRVLHQRHPELPVLVADARVQGEGAAFEVARALRWLSATDVDVVVVTRGGGSVEDLWTFNEEAVARAIHACPVPVVSAVGHEIDFTIADFVADHRCPTPSAAAERLAPVLRDLELQLATTAGRLRRAAERRVLECRQQLHRRSARLGDPRRALSSERLRVADSADRMARVARQALRSERERLAQHAERLQRQRPQTRLGEFRGRLAALKERLREAMRARLAEQAEGLAERRVALVRAAPTDQVHRARERLTECRVALAGAAGRAVSARRARFQRLVGGLEAMSPLAVLSRGYSLTVRPDGSVVRAATDVAPGDVVVVRVTSKQVGSLDEADWLEAQVLSTRRGGA